MRALAPLTLAFSLALSLALAPGCTVMVTRPLGFYAHAAGGRDAARGSGEPDLVFVSAGGVAGLARGLNALAIPGDWHARPRRARADGREELVVPLELDWRVGAGAVPEARPVRTGLAFFQDYAGEPRLPVAVRLGGPEGRGLQMGSSTRPEGFLEPGEDHYVLAPGGGSIKRGFDVWGLDHPDGGWVHLGRVELARGQRGLARWTANTTGAAAYSLDAVTMSASLVIATPLSFLVGKPLAWDDVREEFPDVPW